LRLPLDISGMADTDDAVEEFLERADTAYKEYDHGYADADATLRRLERHLERLRDAVEE
jgi:archaellum component FlaC